VASGPLIESPEEGQNCPFAFRWRKNKGPAIYMNLDPFERRQPCGGASDQAHASAIVANDEDNTASGSRGKDWVKGDYGPAITGPRL